MGLAILGTQAAGQLGRYFGHVRGHEDIIIDSGIADASSLLLNRIYWKLFSKPPAQNRLEGLALQKVREGGVRGLLSLGYFYLSERFLRMMQADGVKVGVYLTDDMCPATLKEHEAKVLALADDIFTPRVHQVNELRRIGSSRVHYLPFGYCEVEHIVSDRQTFEDCDLFFYGGMDDTRKAWVNAFLDAGLRVTVCGAGWNGIRRRSNLFYAGVLTPSEISVWCKRAKVTLCLVRHSNRDQHSMRSYELPAMGACILAEDTAGHREMFGVEWDAAGYASNPAEAVVKTVRMCRDAYLRSRLRRTAMESVRRPDNTYRERLFTIRSLMFIDRNRRDA